MKQYNYHIIIANQSNPYNAIAANFYKLAQGLSGNRVTLLHLVSCSKEYEEFIMDITESYGVKLKISSNTTEFFQEANTYNHDSSIFVFSAWYTPLEKRWLRFAKTLKKSGFKILLFEYYPLFFDRFSSKRLVDTIITSRPVYKIISRGKSQLYKMADFLIIHWINSAKVVKDYFDIEPNCVIHEAIDTQLFKFSEPGNRNSIVFHYPSEIDEHKFKRIVEVIRAIKPNVVYILGKVPLEHQFSNLPLETILESNYTNQRLKDIYSSAMFSIIVEGKGAFELIPIESIASGVPVIGHKSPSLSILENMLKARGFRNMPFIELAQASEADTRDSFQKLSNNIREISDITREEFSQAKFAQKLTGCVEGKP